MFNQITAVGNLGSDPETRYMPNGDNVTSFNMATNYRFNRSDGSQGEETTWFRVSAWGRLGETAAEHLSRGRMVLVTGRVSDSPYITRDGGEPRSGLQIRAQEIRFLPTGQQAEDQSQQAQNSQDEPWEEPEVAEADMPW